MHYKVSGKENNTPDDHIGRIKILVRVLGAENLLAEIQVTKRHCRQVRAVVGGYAGWWKIRQKGVR
jgi:hypothetical protein